MSADHLGFRTHPRQRADVSSGAGRLHGQTVPGVLRTWAGFASLGAGLVHTAVIREHFEHWWAFGIYFAVLSVYQLGWCLAAMSARSVPLKRVTLAVNGGVVGLWLVTRTIGLPVGPGKWEPEALGRADVAATAMQILIIGLLLLHSRVSARAGSRRLTSRSVLVLLAVGALAVSAITTPALASTEAGKYARPHGSRH